MKNIFLSFNRQSPFGFRRGNFVLTLRRRSLTIFICFSLLLRIIIELLFIKKLLDYLNNFLNNLASMFLPLDHLVLSSGLDGGGRTINQLNDKEQAESAGDSESEEPGEPQNESEQPQSDDEAEGANNPRSPAEDSGIEVSDQGSPNDHVPDIDSEDEERAKPEKDDLELIEDALEGDFEAIAEAKEKYPAFFDDWRQSINTDLKNLKEYIESESRANPASPSPSLSEEYDDYISPEAGPSEGDHNSPEAGPSVMPEIQSTSKKHKRSESTDDLQSEDKKKTKIENNEDDSSFVMPEKQSASKKHKRSESTDDLQSEDKKKTKTENNNDDDDSNNNPPKGGSLGGNPPAEDGGSGSNEGSNSSNSMSIIEMVVLVLSTVMEFIAKGMDNIF